MRRRSIKLAAAAAAQSSSDVDSSFVAVSSSMPSTTGIKIITASASAAVRHDIIGL
jgi:hypothetical protein